MDQRDGASIAVPDEKCPADARSIEDLGKGVETLVVHIGERPGKSDRIGAAVSGAAVNERAASRLPGERRRKIPPRRGATDAVVEKDKRGRIFRAGSMPKDLYAQAACDDGLDRGSPDGQDLVFRCRSVYVRTPL
jgi:hypothetical protein